MNINQQHPLIQQFMRMSNPQQEILNMLKQYSTENPLMQNFYQMAQNNDTEGIIDTARNIFKEHGRDFDTEFNQFKQFFKMK